MIEDPIRSAFEHIDADASDDFRDGLHARLLAELLADDATGGDDVTLTSEPRRGGRATVLLAAAAAVAVIGLAAIALVNGQDGDGNIDTGTVPPSQIDETTTPTINTAPPTTTPTINTAPPTTVPTAVPTTASPIPTVPPVTSAFGDRTVTLGATLDEIVPAGLGWIYSSDGQVLYNATGLEAHMGGLPKWVLRLYDPVTLDLERELDCPIRHWSGTAMPWWNDEVAAAWDDQARAAYTALSARFLGQSWRCRVGFSADGSRAAAFERLTGGPQTVLWNATDGAEIAQFEGASPVFSPDGSLLAVIVSATGVVRIHDAVTGAPIGEVEPENIPFNTEWQAAFAPDGNTLVTIGWAIEVWNLDSFSRQTVITSTEHFVPFQGISFSTDGTTMTTSQPSHASVWDLTTGEELLRLDDFGDPTTGQVSSSEFAADDTFVVTTIFRSVEFVDGTVTTNPEILVHDALTGAQITLPTSPDAVNDYADGIAFSPEGNSMTIVTIGGSPAELGPTHRTQRWVFDAN